MEEKSCARELQKILRLWEYQTFDRYNKGSTKSNIMYKQIPYNCNLSPGRQNAEAAVHSCF